MSRHTTIDHAISEAIEGVPVRIVAGVIRGKLLASDVELSMEECSELAKQVLAERTDRVSVYSSTAGGDVTIHFTDDDTLAIEAELDKFTEKLPLLVAGVTADAASSLLVELRKRWKAEARRQRRDTRNFQDRLRERWGKALEVMRMLVTLAREYGSNVGTEGVDGPNQMPVTLHVLKRLHARSCQVFEEVLCLLDGGFADGAMARWRTLHEIAAVAYLLSRFGDELSQRYTDHQVVESWKAATQYQRTHELLGLQPFEDGELDAIKKEYDEAIAKYGKSFGSAQGWAAKHLGKDSPTFADIQEAASIGHLAPYYRMASHNVHANPKGVFFKLGLLRASDALLAGPSNAGLADPGHSAALSLVQVSSALLSLDPTLDNSIAVRVMSALTDEIGKVLILAHEKLDQDYDAARKS